MLTMMVTTRIAKAITLERLSEVPISPREGRRFPMAVQRRTVPESLVSWSMNRGMAVLRSTGSLVQMARTAKVAALREKRRQGNHNLRCRMARMASKPMAAAQRREAAVM